VKTFANALLMLTLCATATPAAASCLRMEGPPPGFAAGVGPLLVRPDGNVSLRPFLNGGGWTAGGTATIVATNFAAGSPVQEMNLNNINLHVVPNPAVGSVTFAYADFGGNVNLAVNGVLVSLGELMASPGMLGGVNVAVTKIVAFGYHYGVVTLTGGGGVAINAFAVGGQEFYVDDVCW